MMPRLCPRVATHGVVGVCEADSVAIGVDDTGNVDPGTLDVVAGLGAASRGSQMRFEILPTRIPAALALVSAASL